MEKSRKTTAWYHLPGLFEFAELYRLFLPLFREHREYFYDWCDIGSVYGAPADSLWGGGRVGFGDCRPRDVIALMHEYGIPMRLTFSNSLLRQEHLQDAQCNRLCAMLQREGNPRNGVIVHSELLLDHLKRNYPELCLISSTTKVLTDFGSFLREVQREEFSYAVPDFRLNPELQQWASLPENLRSRVEFLCNECCRFDCTRRKACYENVSRKALGESAADHVCAAPEGEREYRFSRAMANPGFIGLEGIRDVYLPMGYTNFKIEGRSLGSAVVLEFLLYYMTRPEYQLQVREAIYLDSALDLF